MPLTAKQAAVHPCYCVFDPDGKPLWHTCRASRDECLTSFEGILGVEGYTLREMQMVETKGK